MKRLINYLSIAAVVAFLWAITALTTDGLAARSRFGGLPLGTRTPIRFSFDVAAIDGTPLERRNQLRDWLLYTVVSDAALDGEAMQHALFDLPPLRTGYVEPVARFEYGAIRSRTIGAGEVIALVPKSAEAERLNNLAAVADQEYKTTGRRPRVIHLFEYELSENSDTAWLTRLGDVDGAEVFTERYGYVEKAVRSAVDLASFLDACNDITSSRFVNGEIVLGGRRVAGYRGLRVEDVAALWQAEAEPRRLQGEIDAFEARWKSRTYRFDFERAALQQQHDAELEALKGRIAALSGGRGLEDASGFSLDPVFDYEALTALTKRYEPVLRTAANRRTPGAAGTVDDILQAVERRNAGPLLDLVYEMSTSRDPVSQLMAALLKGAIDGARFQQARYDGALQGTEVGMVLFYTDLLAKLWAMDYERSAPIERVEDFVPLLNIGLSPIFHREMQELSGTRLWFGARDDGFQKTHDGIVMARTATRVYAASSNTLKPGEEGEPNATSASFLWWWNNHYDAVAAAEPEYQRLDEIMKWGLVLSRMTNEQFEALSFLQPVSVFRGYWFPEWVRANPQLAFKGWEHVGFLPRGYKQTTTEALPRLHSRRENGRQLAGGVSLPSRRILADRPSLSEATPVVLRRSTIKEATTTAEGRVLKSFDDLTFELRTGATAAERVVVARPRPAARLRGSDFEVRNDTFAYAFEQRGDGLAVRMQQGQASVGELSIRKTAGGFETAFLRHEMERARTMLRVLDEATARGIDVPTELARVAGAERVVAADATYFVELQSSGGRWLRIAEEGTPSVKIGEGHDLRFAGVGAGGGGKRWAAEWVDGDAVAGELRKGQYIRVRNDGNALEGIVAQPTTRGPPAAAEGTELLAGARKVKAWRDRDGWTYIAQRPDVDPWPTLAAAKSARRTAVPDAVRDFHRYVQNGDFERTARLLADRRLEATAILDGYRKSILTQADTLLSAGRPREAASALDRANKVFPRDPDIRLRRAIALLDDNRPESALRVLDDGLRGATPAEADRLFAAVDRLPAGAVAEHGTQDLATLARAADLRGRLNTAGSVKGSVSVAADRTGTLRMEVRLLDWQAATGGTRAGSSRRAVYVEVGSDFDPAIGVRQSVEQLISDATFVSRLTSWEIRSALPEVIVDGKTGVKYARVGTPLWRRGPPMRLNRSSCDEGAEAEPSQDCGDDVYLVRTGGAVHP